MQTYYLALEIPKLVKDQLAALCFGPPQIHWTEKDHLYFMLRPLENLSDSELNDLMNQLDGFFFEGFSFILQGIDHKHFKGGGVIGVGAGQNADMLKLIKEMDQTLRGLKLKKNYEMPFPIILGHYDLGHGERISFERLGDYLMAHALFRSDPIDVTGIILLRTWQSTRGRGTGGGTVYEELAYYPASESATGED